MNLVVRSELHLQSTSEIMALRLVRCSVAGPDSNPSFLARRATKAKRNFPLKILLWNQSIPKSMKSTKHTAKPQLTNFL